MLGGECADLAGSDHHDASSVEPPEDLACEGDGREADRHRTLAERGLRAYALAHTERPVEQLGENRPGASAFRRLLERVLHLPENLRLADDDRVETGRHTKQ